MGMRRFVSHELPLSLPPLDLQLHNLQRDGRIDTPLDDRGLVELRELIYIVKQTVEPGYDWQSSFNDVHHLEWPARAYQSLPHSQLNPQEFRNLAISKAYVPRVFHNWVHRITEPPPVPDVEVMYYRTEAQRAAFALFKTVRASRGLIRLKSLSEQELHSRLIQNFDEFSNDLELTRSIPAEFQLLDIADYTPRNIEDMFSIQSQLGKIATIPVATRIISLPAVA